MVIVSSIEELDTRSMHIQTPLGSLPATGGSHVQRAILSQAPTMKRHISSRARIGLRSGERVGIGTVSTTVARSFNGNARSSSQVKVLVGHQRASLTIAFLVASDACTSHAPTLHAICFGPRWADSHDAWLSARPIRTVVRRRRWPQKVHAQKTRDGRSRRQKSSYVAPYQRVLS